MKKRVLFVCIGNAIRSQMAEGFARAYGWDCILPASGGLAPATGIDPTAVKIMADIGIDIGEQFPKQYQAVARMEFDQVINISGYPLPGNLLTCPVEVWEVDDPVGRSEELYRGARDLLQRLTLQLVNEIRSSRPVPVSVPQKTTTGLPGNMILDRKRRLRQSS